MNILQAAVSSAGLTAVMMQPTASSVAQPLSTVNTQQLAQTQFIPAVAFSNGTIQVQATPAGQIQVNGEILPILLEYSSISLWNLYKERG